MKTNRSVWRLLTTLAVAAAAVAPAAVPAAPYPPSTVITDLQFDFSNHVRRAPGADNWPLTWGSDDNQYTSWGDGFGFDGGSTKISLGYSRITGTKESWTGRDTYGSENAEAFATISGKSYAILSLGGVLYSFVSPGSENQNVTKATLYKSTDLGNSWNVTTVEFTAAAHALMLPCILQFGRDYAGARDGYVYTYWTRVKTLAWGIQKPGQIVLMRVPTGSIENQSEYQVLSGYDGSGNPTWSNTVSSAVPVFEDPEGVMTNSVVYSPALARYLLITVHTDWQAGNLAFFDAPGPWGPWTTVKYYYGWPPGGQVERSAFYANFSPKWFGPSPSDFVLVFTGTSSNDTWNSVPGTFVLGVVAGVTGEDVPPTTGGALSIDAAGPNPFSGATSFRYSVANPLRVKIAIYNAAGARVRTLADGVLSGAGTVSWDGRTTSGTRAPAGIYLLRAEAGGARESWKIVMMK